MSHTTGLRVALIWKGAVLQEHIFQANKNEKVLFTDDTTKKHAMVVPEFHSAVEGFVPDGNDYMVRFPESATGSITRKDKETSLENLKSEAKSAGTVTTLKGSETLYEIKVTEGDWGLITVGEVSIFFQLRDNTLATPITAFELPFKGPLAASILISGVIHATLLMICMLSPTYPPDVVQMKAFNRFASFIVEDVQTPPEEEEVPDNVPIEEDTTGKKAGGEEGKFGDEDSEFEESKIPKTDGEMTDKIDVKNIGVNKALSSNVIGSGALKNIFGNSDGIEAKMNVAMSGEGGTLQVGRGAGGMGFHGTGSGGGGEGMGRIGGLGKVDTGGGKGTGAKIGKRKRVQAQPKMHSGTPSLGDFCDKNNIRRVVNAKNRAIKYCFEKELQSNPELKGKIVASWKVGLDGAVMGASIASSTLNNKAVESCVTRVIKTMRFQKPEGGICVIQFPFVFTGLE